MIEWPWFTADELGQIFCAKPSYVRNLATKGNWRRRWKGRRMTYSWEDASRDLEHGVDQRRQSASGRAEAEEIARDTELYGDLGLRVRHAGQ